MTGAAGQWSGGLSEWAIPPAILTAAPQSPYEFAVEDFAGFARAEASDTPSRRRALEALPEGGTVVDVGCGAGAASISLAPRAARVVGIDESPGMLEAFERIAANAGLQSEAILGRWPDVAPWVAPADVVVCHHVLFNVADLEPFARALFERARSRVVIEMTERHPLAWTAPYWRALHGLDRPWGPTADDAIAVLIEAGFTVNVERWEAPFRLADAGLDALVATVRRRLCLSPARDEEVRAAILETPPPETRSVATIWWESVLR
ncbi:MAG: methyltransferase domain-containing protein [Actinomycetota bacterium]